MNRPGSKLTAVWETWPLPAIRRAMSTPCAGSGISVKTCDMRRDNCEETPDLLLRHPDTGFGDRAGSNDDRLGVPRSDCSRSARGVSACAARGEPRPAQRPALRVKDGCQSQ